MKKTTYTISIYTENNVGLLNRVSAIFLKRHINIASVTSSESEIPDIYRFVIVVNLTKEQVVKVVKQIDKQIEVISVFYHTDKQTIFLETALYKVKSSSLFEEKQIQNIIRDSRANIVTVKPDYFVIEKTGWRVETEDLYQKLKPYGLLQFVRSGRISVSKKSMEISKILKNK